MTSFKFLAARVVFAAFVAIPFGANAQGATPAPAAPPAVTAGWQDGFFVQSANGDFRLQVGLLVHSDGRFARRFEFYFVPDFAGGTLVVQDAYVDTVFTPAFRIRAGKGKTPFGLERLHSALNLLFFERALPIKASSSRIGTTAFVMNFFGTVNVFPGQGEGGRTAYARPHEMDVSRTPAGPNGSVPATVDDIGIAGVVVRLVLRTAEGAPVHVEMTRDRFDALALRKGGRLHVMLSDLRSFAEPRQNR